MKMYLAVKKRSLENPDSSLSKCTECVFVERDRWGPPCRDCKVLPGNSHKNVSYYYYRK